MTGLAELVLQKGGTMQLRVQVPTTELPKFFIGATVKVMGQPCLIEEMRSEQSNVGGLSSLPITLTVLVL